MFLGKGAWKFSEVCQGDLNERLCLQVIGCFVPVFELGNKYMSLYLETRWNCYQDRI